MATNYPAALDTTTQLPNTRADATVTATNHITDHNNLSDAVRAVEGELGTIPSASFVDVATRLNAMTTVRKTASQNMTGTAAVNITDLAFPIPAAAGAFYTFDFTVVWQSTTLTAGMGISLTWPTLGTGGVTTAQVQIGALAVDGAGELFSGTINGASGADVVLSTATAVINVNYVTTVRGVLYSGTTANTAGTLQLQGRSEVTAGACTIQPGSHGIMWVG